MMGTPRCSNPFQHDPAIPSPSPTSGFPSTADSFRIPSNTQGRNRPAHASNPAGMYAVLPGTVWVISSYNRFSFDSRYFGAISLDEKVQYAKPFWLF